MLCSGLRGTVVAPVLHVYCPCFIEGIHLAIRSGLPEQVVKFKLSMLSTLSYYIRNQIYLIVPLKNTKMLLVQTMFITNAVVLHTKQDTM